MTNTELAILADIGLCLAVYVAGKVCDAKEIDEIFDVMPDRLKLQGFAPEVSAKMITTMKTVVLDFAGNDKRTLFE